MPLVFFTFSLVLRLTLDRHFPCRERAEQQEGGVHLAGGWNAEVHGARSACTVGGDGRDDGA
eukprot:1138750-Pyramimonas_sp.AAC.1